MPHRPIGSRWRCNTNRFTTFPNGSVIVVVDNSGGGLNTVRLDGGTRIHERWTLGDEHWVAVDQPIAAPAPAAPPPPPTRFEPFANEMYMVVYRRTFANASANYGRGQEVTQVQNRFSLARNGERNSVHNSLEEARAALRLELGRSLDYDGYIVPLRAVEHWHAGVQQPFPVEIVALAGRVAPPPAEPDDDDDDF